MIMSCNDDNDDDAMMAMMVIRSAESWQRADVIKHLALTAPHLPEQLLDGIIIVFMFINHPHHHRLHVHHYVHRHHHHHLSITIVLKAIPTCRNSIYQIYDGDKISVIISTVRCSYISCIQRSYPSHPIPTYPHIALSVQYHSMVI